MPQYQRTDSFKSDYKKLIRKNPELKNAATKAFLLFQDDPGHPSLKIKRLRGHRGIWEGHITDKYVFTFSKEKAEDGELIYTFRPQQRYKEALISL